MKIVTWNCNGAFRKKFESVSTLNADINIIQECENPVETADKKYQIWAENYLWIGDSKNKGIGVFAKERFKLKKLEWSNLYKDHCVKHFLPCEINEEFELLAVWTHFNNSPTFGYIGQFWKYLQINKGKLNKVIIVGDFNSNSIWDLGDRWWNHSDVVQELNGMGIDSFYHISTGEKQGKETIPTFYFQKRIEKSYHIDYFFGTKEFSKNIKKIEIGSPDKWLKLSDHMPLLCEL